jgi:dynein intermediate chain
LNKLISSLVDRPGSAALKEASEAASPRRASRPSSVLSAGQLSLENADVLTPPTRPLSQSIATQTLSSCFSKIEILPDPAPVEQKATITYSKAVQTTEPWSQNSRSVGASLSDSENEGAVSTKTSKRLSRRERERDSEIRENLRREIEEELRASQQTSSNGHAAQSSRARFPLRTLTNDELNAVTSSDDFLDFVERSSKVIERALDDEYDVLANYAKGDVTGNKEADDMKGVKEIAQFWDERWSKKRMISDISFSPKVSPPKSHQPHL